MATIKKVKREKGTAFVIGFMHPDTNKWTTKTVYCTKAVAMKIKSQIEADVAYGRFGFKNPNQRKYLWSQLLERYKKYSKRNKSQKTVDREENVFKAFKKFLNKDVYLHEITAETISIYKQKRLEMDKKPATVSIELRVLKAVFNKAIEWSMIDKNPVKGIKLPKSQIKVRFLHKDETDRLFAVIEEDGNIPFLRLIKAYLYTGTRRSQLLPPKFTWDNVDFKARTIFISEIKGEDDRYIVMSDKMYEILNDINNEGSLFPFDFKPDFVSHKIQKYYKKADIDGANLHSLRKTGGSRMLDKQRAGVYQVSKFLGHKDINTTQKFYIDLTDQSYREMAKALDELI